MSFNIHWLLDPAADPQRSEPGAQRTLPSIVRDRRTPSRNRFDYYTQVAQAAAQTGFDGLVIRHRITADESRIIAAVVARAVPRLLVTPEFPASVGSAVYAAKQAATFQRSTQGRLGWAIAPDASPEERQREADFIDEDALTQRLDEFLTVARGVHGQRPFTFRGRFFEVENGGFDDPLTRYPFPRIFLQGEEDDRLALSARHADVHWFRLSPAEELAASVGRLNEAAADRGRRVAAGVIVPLLVREDQESAEAEAAALGVGEEVLVGSYESVAEQIAGYAAAGIEELRLEAAPLLEETYRIGQHLLPRLRAIAGIARRAA